MRTRDLVLLPALLAGLGAPAAAQAPAGTVRVGIIGLDTSHSVAFAKVLNDPNATPDVAGFRVVAAYPFGSRTIQSSTSRIPGYQREFQEMGIEVTGTVEELLGKVDAVLLETNDGRLHLEQALQVFRAGKPVFIDKPIAASLEDAVTIFDAARRYRVPVFSASSLRWAGGVQKVRGGSIGKVLGADTYSPATLEPTHPDLYWYGVHGVEMLFAAMGPGAVTVRRVFTDSTDVVVGEWADGRVGVFRGMRWGKHDYGGTAYGTGGIAPLGPYEGYRPLVAEIAKFFRTGVAPVSPEETLEIFAFMQAADESKVRRGAPVRVADMLAIARARAKRRPL